MPTIPNEIDFTFVDIKKKPQQPLLTRLLELQINKHLNYTNKHYVFHINIKNQNNKTSININGVSWNIVLISIVFFISNQYQLSSNNHPLL